MANLTPSQIADGIIEYLKARKVSNLLPEVIDSLRSHSKSSTEVRVESAIALTPSEKSELVKTLASKFGVKSDIDYVVNPKILGGLRIIIGDQVLDTTILARLNNLYAS
jgi:F-type H+-transporting ATPase subunit delta